MAGITTFAGNLCRRVRKCGRHETGGLMAQDTIIIRRHMRAMFARRGNAVVTASAITGDTSVIVFRTGKCGGVMTVRAIPIYAADNSRWMTHWFRRHC